MLLEELKRNEAVSEDVQAKRDRERAHLKGAQNSAELAAHDIALRCFDLQRNLAALGEWGQVRLEDTTTDVAAASLGGVSVHEPLSGADKRH